MHTLGLEQVLLSWTMSSAMEMKQTSLNVDTMGLEFTTVDPVKMLGFSAVLVSQFIETQHYMSALVCITFAKVDSIYIVFTVGRVERCTVDVETTLPSASQTIVSIEL